MRTIQEVALEMNRVFGNETALAIAEASLETVQSAQKQDSVRISDIKKLIEEIKKNVDKI